MTLPTLRHSTSPRPRAVPLIGLIVTLLIWLSATPAAFAQQEDPSIDAMLDRIGESTVPDSTEPLPASSLSAINLGVHWQLWQRTINDGGQPGLEALDTLRHDAMSVGIPSLPRHQAAVLQVARTAEQRDLSAHDGRQLIEKANVLAPHLPYAHLELVHWRLGRDLASFPRAIPDYTEGIEKTYRWLDTRIAWALRGALWLLIVGGIGLMGFLLGQLLRYFGIAAYDGTRLLPRGFSSTQTVIVLLAIVLVPGLVMQSPLLSMILLLILVTPFQQFNERLIAACFFAFIAALPFIDSQVERLRTYPGSQAQQLLHAHYHGCADDCRPWLSEFAETNDLASLVWHLEQFRSADGDDMQTLEQALAARDMASTPALSAHWHSLYGAVLIANGEADEALSVLEEATAQDPMAVAPWFNQMRAYQILDDDAGSEHALEQAFHLDLWATSRQMEMSRRDPHSFLMTDTIDSDLFWETLGPQAGDKPGLIAPVWTVLAGEEIDFSLAPFFGIAGLLFLLLTWPLRRVTSTPCPKCGLARDPNDAAETGNHHYCRPCYGTFVSGSTMDYHARVHSEATLGRRDRLQSGLRRLLSALTPGVGHILGGHAIRGTLTLMIISFGVLLLILPQGPTGAWLAPLDLYRVDWVGQNILAWLFISMAGSVALTGLIRGIDPTRVRSSTSDGGSP